MLSKIKQVGNFREMIIKLSEGLINLRHLTVTLRLNKDLNNSGPYCKYRRILLRKACQSNHKSTSYSD